MILIVPNAGTGIVECVCVCTWVYVCVCVSAYLSHPMLTLKAMLYHTRSFIYSRKPNLMARDHDEFSMLKFSSLDTFTVKFPCLSNESKETRIFVSVVSLDCCLLKLPRRRRGKDKWVWWRQAESWSKSGQNSAMSRYSAGTSECLVMVLPWDAGGSLCSMNGGLQPRD